MTNYTMTDVARYLDTCAKTHRADNRETTYIYNDLFNQKRKVTTCPSCIVNMHKAIKNEYERLLKAQESVEPKKVQESVDALKMASEAIVEEVKQEDKREDKRESLAEVLGLEDCADHGVKISTEELYEHLEQQYKEHVEQTLAQDEGAGEVDMLEIVDCTNEKDSKPQRRNRKK